MIHFGVLQKKVYILVLRLGMQLGVRARKWNGGRLFGLQWPYPGMLLLHGLWLETALVQGRRCKNGATMVVFFVFSVEVVYRGETTYFSNVVLVNAFGRLYCKHAWWMRFIPIGELYRVGV